ncbi:MAG: 5,5'-dehydrodivanillate O-demethylase [Chloroflexi bacterium]|jgi:5,5'-dehydrodivanillate O-demethylase|nr:MAG: 5,5'-dehydrodivanillate O-demethylase [Chloroflexota bacterium]
MVFAASSLWYARRDSGTRITERRMAMLSVEENLRLTQVGPGTPMGELMRRYWHPVAPTLELEENPTKEVRLLGEDLVLYKDRSGGYGLIERLCAHRRVNLAYGIPEEHGLRCMYHGWLYDETGQCIEQPFEETVRPESRFRDKIKLSGYPVREFAGLLWAYMGPQPAPLITQWEPLVRDNVVREIVVREIVVSPLQCNWLQCQENSVDPIHVEWMHVYFTAYQETRLGAFDNVIPSTLIKHEKIGFSEFPHGIVRRRVLEGQSEEDKEWKVGHPLLFPNINWASAGPHLNFQFRIPADDNTTTHITCYLYTPAPGEQAPKQDHVPYRYVSRLDTDGKPNLRYVLEQDKLAWESQGPTMDRSAERLGESDEGLIMFRRQLQEQLAVVEDGGDPMNVMRQEHLIELPMERLTLSRTLKDAHMKYVPVEIGEPPALEEINQVMATWNNR